MVKALFFDLTDTLQCFDWGRQWQLFPQFLEKELGFKVDAELLKQKYQQVYESYRLGWVSKDSEFFGLLFKQLAWNVSKEQLKRIEKKHLEIRREFTSLPENFVQSIKALKENFTIGIVTSGVRIWADYDFRRIFGLNLSKLFHFQVWSQDTGFLKESGKLFEIALKKTKLKASDAAFVGNDYNADVLTAKKFGVKTVFLNLKNEPLGVADLQVSSFKELAEKIPELKNLESAAFSRKLSKL